MAFWNVLKFEYAFKRFWRLQRNACMPKEEEEEKEKEKTSESLYFGRMASFYKLLS